MPWLSGVAGEKSCSASWLSESARAASMIDSSRVAPVRERDPAPVRQQHQRPQARQVPVLLAVIAGQVEQPGREHDQERDREGEGEPLELDAPPELVHAAHRSYIAPDQEREERHGQERERERRTRARLHVLDPAARAEVGHDEERRHDDVARERLLLRARTGFGDGGGVHGFALVEADSGWKTSSIRSSKRRATAKASGRLGSYFSVSMALTVWRETPRRSASSAWLQSRSARSTRRRFFMATVSSMLDIMSSILV